MSDPERLPVLFVHSLQGAMAILEEINKVGVTIPKNDIYVKTFGNLREQGLCVEVHRGTGNPLYVCFARYRTSDELVVYQCDRVGLESNIPLDDKAWEEAVFFREDAYADAADFVIRTVEDFYHWRRF